MKDLDSELDLYVRQAWERNAALYEPPAYGKPFRSPLFEFVRAIKAHPTIGEKDGFTAAEILSPHLACFCPSGKGDPWPGAFPHSEDPLAEFVETWDKIKWPRAALAQALHS